MFFSDYSSFRFEDIYRVNRKHEICNGGRRLYASIAYRISGESVFNSENNVYHANTGSLIYIPGEFNFTRESTDEELYIIHLSSCDPKMNTIDIIYSDRAQILKQLNMIHKEYNEKIPGYMHRCTAMIYTLLSTLQNFNHNLSTYKYNLIQPGIEYIDSHFDDPGISIGIVSEMCNISPEYFRKLYKDEFGISPQKAINSKRIEKSCKMLLSGYFTVREVAESSGFEDAKNFSTFFKKNTKMTPKEFETIYNKS